MLRVIGEVVRYSADAYSIANDDGTRNEGVSRKARVQTARGEFADVKIPTIGGGTPVPEPRDGDFVDWLVEARPVYGKAGQVEVRVSGVYDGEYRVVDSKTGALVGADA